MNSGAGDSANIEKGRSWFATVVLPLGGAIFGVMSSYYLGIASLDRESRERDRIQDIKTTEIASRQMNVIERLGKVEALTADCHSTSARHEYMMKEIEDLTKNFKEFEQRLRDHDELTRRGGLPRRGSIVTPQFTPYFPARAGEG